ncbi:TAXI family TRAP transporter solute-binding subunit [Kutzneria sp. CA-103260]|uniref:TAXI family TRAP transporter solute-binding subunit n=1 Tax=Kutzneria sp. CA-103260 TaxID=2802641 RepID=UPI001BF04C53|nr:TAXI family TRAP transporter solute-binding subunit [Kutzneria sp. CA-103260]QUQ72128.1 TRAP transport system solute receptor [Kutzneria sp. CA-103260]
MALTRRALIVLGATATLAGPSLAACGSSLSGVQLRVATGGTGGVYFTLGGKLADAWRDRLGVAEKVLTTSGSVENLGKLHNNTADVAFVAADAAAKDGAKGLRALARIYDDYIQVLVRNESPIKTLADLRGRPVSIGSENSGVKVVAQNLLAAAGLPDSGPTYFTDSLHQSLGYLVAGQRDALFWSGGLPTPDITATMKSHPDVTLRMLDLTKDNSVSLRYYNVETVPQTSYPLLAQTGKPVSTLAVHNLLMVRENMPDDEAEALVRTLFDVQPDLANDSDQVVSLAAQLIDPRSAIESAPIALHDGALAYYRSAKV